ncbi:hypothetical protein KI387_034524, partial [Taxus chinensis]
MACAPPLEKKKQPVYALTLTKTLKKRMVGEGRRDSPLMRLGGCWAQSSCHGVLVAVEVGTLGPEDLYELWQHLRFNLISVIVCSTLL